MREPGEQKNECTRELKNKCAGAQNSLQLYDKNHNFGENCYTLSNMSNNLNN